jgi:hypothetical protein
VTYSSVFGSDVFKSSAFKRGCWPLPNDRDFDKSCSLKESIEAFKKECGLEKADNSIDKTLKERGERYGSFSSHAALSQAFKDVAKTGDSYELLSASQLEALEMIFHKIARILNGDPDYADSWHDIAGYASLVEKELSE